MRPRHIAAVALVLGLAIAGFVVARLDAERDARHGSEQRVGIAAAQIRSRVEAATSLTESLRRFMSDEGSTGVTNGEFARNAVRWLSPADLPAAAWAEAVRTADRAAYERRIGRRIVTPGDRGSAAPPGASYLPATLVSGFPPMDSRGIDLRAEPGIAEALRRAIVPGGVGATPVTTGKDGMRGLFLVAPAPNQIDGVLRPGAVVVFLSEATLHAAARNPAGLRFPPADRSPAAGGDTVRDEFAVAGQQFAVVMPKASVSGPGAILPWFILAGGLLLAALAAANGVIGGRRARALRDFDRIFNLSPDLVAVADFDGYFTRVNPAAEQLLGYTADELLARPYLDFVHPDDRERTAAESAAIRGGRTTRGFENRYVRKDGSHRVLEWTATPVPDERLMYSVGRDVTERRHAEAEVERLADEQAALRRVATLVAEESSPEEVFAKVADEVATVLGHVDCALWRDEGDGTASAVAVHGASVAAGIEVGTRLSLDGDSVTAVVLREGRPWRIEDYSAATGTFAARARELGLRAATGCPILVGGRTWGAMAVATYGPDPLPPGTESRLERFSELVATSISNAQAHAEVERLAEEQAALRRVATLVAEGVSPAEIFTAVSEEVGRLLATGMASVGKFEHDPPAVVVVGLATSVPGIAVGSRWELGDSMTSMQVYRTGSAARVDGMDWSEVDATIAGPARRLGVISTVSSPIIVEGRVWGVLTATSREPLPPDSEERLAKFTEVIATAIGNAESRGALRELAEEQAALRRVATLVAQGASPTAVFDAVAAEMERLLDADQAVLSRFELGDEVTVVAHRGPSAQLVPPGTRVRLDGDNVQTLVRRTNQPARSERYQQASGTIAELARHVGVRSVVGAPIVVDGRLWGVISASWNHEESPPADTERRMAKFAQLLDAAIANADSRDQLTASRARLVAAGDDARRRLARDLHDGAQQRLVHTIVTLKLAKRALHDGNGEAQTLVGEALEQAQQGNTELRELAHGILPRALTHGGLRAGVDSFVHRLDLPVHVDVPARRLPAEIEASAYFIVAEALTNVLKHAKAGHADVTATLENGALRVEVRDDGIGGADPYGHGLVGIADRVSALGGRLHIDSTPGAGTVLAATLPVSTD